MRPHFKIAMIAACPFPYPRGTPIRVFHLTEQLIRLGHEVHVITYHLGNDSPRLDFAVHRIPRIITYRKLTPGPTLQKLFLVDALLTYRLRRVLQDQGFDVIHAHHFEGLLAALFAQIRPRIPVIFDCHTLLTTELPFYSFGSSPNA